MNLLLWWLMQIRDGRADRAEAARLSRAAEQHDLQAALAPHDAAVAAARAPEGGLRLGTARTARGAELMIGLRVREALTNWLVQGTPGGGKTTWIAWLLRQALDARLPIGAIDGKGDLYATTLAWVAAIGHRLDGARREAWQQSFAIVNLIGEYLTPLNVLYLQAGVTADSLAYEVSRLVGGVADTPMGVQMQAVLRYAVRLLIAAKLTLLELIPVLENERLLHILVARYGTPTEQAYFSSEYRVIPEASKRALLGRLHGLFVSEPVRLCLGADTCLDFRAVFERGTRLLMNLGPGLNVPEELRLLFGALLLLLLFQGVFARDPARRGGYLLLFDEFVPFLEAPGLDRRFQTLVTTARSFGLSLCLVHHNFAQLSPSLRETLLANSDCFGLFRTSGHNAQFLGDVFPDADPELLADLWAAGKRTAGREEIHRHHLEALQRLPNRTLYFYDRRGRHRAIRLRVPAVPEPHEVAGMSAAALDAVIRSEGWARGGFAVPRAELQAQIEARQRRLQELLQPSIRVSAPRAPTAPRRSTNKKSRPTLG